MDADSDGDLDGFLLCGMLITDEASRAFENDGQGNFTPAPWTMPRLQGEIPRDRELILYRA